MEWLPKLESEDKTLRAKVDGLKMPPTLSDRKTKPSVRRTNVDDDQGLQSIGSSPRFYQILTMKITSKRSKWTCHRLIIHKGRRLWKIGRELSITTTWEPASKFLALTPTIEEMQCGRIRRKLPKDQMLTTSQPSHKNWRKSFKEMENMFLFLHGVLVSLQKSALYSFCNARPLATLHSFNFICLLLNGEIIINNKVLTTSPVRLYIHR